MLTRIRRYWRHAYRLKERSMNALLRNTFVLAAAVFATQALAQVTIYEHEGFAGRSFTSAQPVVNLERFGFNDRASSVVVKGDRWEVCDDARFGGRCMVLRPGRYPSLAAMGLNDKVSSVRAVRRDSRVDDNRYAPLPPAPVVSQATFYEQENFQGRSFSTARPVENLRRSAFNARASSIVVVGDRFEVCDEPQFGGRCVVLRPGRYPSIASLNLSNRVASVRDVSPAARIDESRYAPLLAPAPMAGPAPQDFRRRRDERIYEGNVTSVRAVVGPPEQRCWVERAPIVEQNKPSVPGAVVGALLGGILGHQVGGGKGQDLATAGGAVAGGVVGANVGGRVGGAPAQAQDLRRCENVPQAAPSFWDVTYTFRGVEHRVQLTAPPGPTIPVNERGEPRA
jgi:uncharacterized protein YcfJ